MRFLADENFPGTAVAALISAGHDVAWVRNAAQGTSDPDVLAWATRDERTLLTVDKDFGELARASALPSTSSQPPCAGSALGEGRPSSRWNDHGICRFKRID
jgi:Domain of unknown function (DUF5615)